MLAEEKIKRLFKFIISWIHITVPSIIRPYNLNTRSNDYVKDYYHLQLSNDYDK